MILQLLFLCMCLGTSFATGYVSTQLPHTNPASVRYVNGQTHYQSRLLPGPAKYPVSIPQGQVYPAQAFQVVGSPSFYSYNLQGAQSSAAYPFHGYAHSGVTPVIYGAVQRPGLVAVSQQPQYYTPSVQSVQVGLQPAHPVVTKYNTAAVQPVYVQPAPQPANPVVTKYHTAAVQPVYVQPAPQPANPVVTKYHTAAVQPVYVQSASQPVHPVVTNYHTPAVQPVYVQPAPQPVHRVITQHHVPTVTAVPVHIPVASVTPVAPIAHVTPVTTTVTKTITREEGPVFVSTESPLPVIKSRKYIVRRPAIQNQFYDIEERVIIRPVGSALVELEQPVSRTESRVRTQSGSEHRTQTVQTQSGGGHSSQGRGHSVITETTVTQRPQVTQTHTVYHTQTPVQHTPVHIQQTYQTPVHVQQTPVHVHQSPVHTQQTPVHVQHTQVVSPNPFIIHAGNTGNVAHPAVTPQVQTPFYVNHYQPVYIPANTIPVTTFRPPHHDTVSAGTSPGHTTVSSTTQTSVDYDDSVVIDVRSGDRTIHSISSTEAPQDYSTLDSTAKYRQSGGSVDSDLPKRGDIAVSYATEATHQSLSINQDNVTEHSTTKDQYVTESVTFRNVDVNIHLASSEDKNKSQAIVDQQHSQSRSAEVSESTVFSPKVVVSNGLSVDQVRTNQEQFIRLLSERDSISEVSYGPNTDSSSSLIDSYVRSRVLSANSAPRDGKESSRTVNIRRIIVSRPIETEQEVEVREQTYHSHGGGSHQITSGSEQVPVYSKAKPPAFANDYAN